MKPLAYLMSALFVLGYPLYWLSVWDVFGIVLVVGMFGIALLAFYKGYKKPAGSAEEFDKPDV